MAIDNISINTVIGAGSSISGDIRVNGRLRVDGDVDGNLETNSNIHVGEASRIHGNIVASSAVIEGVVIGDCDDWCGGAWHLAGHGGARLR